MTHIEETKDGTVFQTETFDQHDAPVLADEGAPTKVDPIVIESGDYKELSPSSVSTKDVKAPAKTASSPNTPAKTK